MAKHLFIMGHGEGDPGASSSASGKYTTERDFFRNEFLPHLRSWAALSKHTVAFYTDNSFARKHLNTLPKDWIVTELHLDHSGTATIDSGGHVIIWGHYVPDEIDRRFMELIRRNFGCRGDQCYDKRTNLQQPYLAANRGINYRLLEMCFVNDPRDMKYFRANINRIARETIEAATGETLVHAQAGGGVYTVKPGDTLGAIAIAHKTTVDQLVRINSITNPNLIFPGQVLRLQPAITPPPTKVFTLGEQVIRRDGKPGSGTVVKINNDGTMVIATGARQTVKQSEWR